MTELSQRLQDALGTAYRVEQELGGGGMSRVFMAEETRLARRVVIKVLPPDLALEMRVDRFNREIQLSASLQHPHIVPLLAAGGFEDLLYYTMPFVEGEALRTRLSREHELPVRDAVRILKDVADALAYAHARGVVHRDIKPDNVLLSGNHAVVADFGVAKAVSQAKTESGLTSVGVALGTPAYMAPEQAAGDPNIDHRADIYAFGAMAYEMLTGRSPFAGMAPHQMLAAHVTEPVAPITDKRPALSPALAQLVMRCLEKNPADRPQSASEILDALDGMATPSGSVAVTSPITTVRHALRRPRNRVAAASAVALLLALGGWLAMRPRTAPALDPNRVVIAPFDVIGPDLQLWREGLVDVLSRSLDGAGPLRTVSPTLVVRRWGAGRADPAAAQALGRETAARTVVYGGLIGAGADSVRLTATVLDVLGPTVLGEIELRERTDRMDRLADSLTVRVLRELGRTRAIGVVRSASLGSRSVPALKAFLQGEQFLRRSAWDSSLAYHQRAIALDSGFTLAWSHAGMAAGWQHRADDSMSRTYKLRAGALNHGLAPRESLIVQSESLAAVVYGGPAQLAGRWWSYGRRLLGTLEEAVRRYPNDPELWYMLGDARYHAGSLAGVKQQTALEAFDRSIALDSSFTPSYVHAVSLGLEFGDTSGARYARAFLAEGAIGVYAQSTALVLDLVDPKTRAGAIGYLADSADEHVVQAVWLSIWRWLDSAETPVAVARARVAAEQRTGRTANLSTLSLPVLLSGRGHVVEAARLTTIPALQAQFAYVGALPADSAGRLARALSVSRGEGPLYAAPLLAGLRDTTGLLRAIRWVDSLRQRGMPPSAPAIAREFLSYLTAQQRAYLALARGDSAEALRLFDALPDSSCFGACHIDDLVHSQLLAARGRLPEAAARLERPLGGFVPGVTPLEVLRALERGRVNERLGNRERAIDGYTTVVRAWRNADPELQPFVDEARKALARLSAETASSAASQ